MASDPNEKRGGVGGIICMHQEQPGRIGSLPSTEVTQRGAC